MTECWCGSHLRVDEQGVIWCAADDEHEPMERTSTETERRVLADA